MTDDDLPIPQDTSLASVAALAAEQIKAEAEVKRLEKELKEATTRLSRVRDDALPTAMSVLGLSEISLADGSRVSVKEHYRCGQLDDGPQKEDGRPLPERLAALTWLTEQGHGDLARRVVSVTLGADSEELAREIVNMIRSHPKGNEIMVDQRRTVPWNTLAAFARQQLNAGEDVPLDTLGVTIQKSTHIKRKEDKI